MAGKVPGGGKRGRPSNAELQRRREAAAEAERIMNGGKASAPSTPAPEPAPAAGSGKPKGGDKAPGFGHNAPDEGVFLRHVHAIQQFKEGPLAEAKAKVKELNGKLKDLRQLAKADGLVLKELDEAVEDARTERVDLVAKETRRRLYRQWLGLPFEQGDLFEEHEGTPSLARDQLRWKALGNTAGRLGHKRVAPEDCPSNMESHWLAGYDEGQRVLMAALPMTAGAFNPDGSLKTASTAPETPASGDQTAAETPADTAPPATAVLILGPADFAADTDLEDANLKTLNADLRERFDAAERVVAVFGGKRRIIKEPGYVDDGEGELTDEEPATSEELAAVGEAEPDAVNTAVQDADDAASDARFEADAGTHDSAGEDDDAPIPGETKPADDSEQFH